MKALTLVFLGGGIGAAIRFLISKASSFFYQGNFPLATFIANVISCVIVGALLYLLTTKVSLEKNITLFLITGVCGGLSTFSTFSYETLELLRQGFWSLAILNIIISLLVCLGILFVFYHRSNG